MVKVVVVGGGFAGCSAAISAIKAGAEVTLIERMDVLLGAGQYAGRITDGQIIGVEEAKAMGGGDIFKALESIMLHRNIEYLDVKNCYFYDVIRQEPIIRRMLRNYGVNLYFRDPVVSVKKEEKKIISIKLKSGEEIYGDAFVDCTGSVIGREACIKYGHGCVECLYKCNTFGDPISLTRLAGAPSIALVRKDGKLGGMGAAVILNKNSLSPELKAHLESKGVVVIPLPKELIDYNKLELTTGYPRTHEEAEHIVLCDVGGYAKIVGGVYWPIEKLRMIPGLENAWIDQPLGGSVGNHIRLVDMTLRSNGLRVEGFKNLFCAGEKSGPIVGIVEAVTSGLLAGHNAVRAALGMDELELRGTAIGELIAHVGERMKTREGLREKYGFHSKWLKERGLYTTDVEEIKRRVSEAGLSDVFATKIC